MPDLAEPRISRDEGCIESTHCAEAPSWGLLRSRVLRDRRQLATVK